MPENLEQALEDSVADISPYEVPAKIWEYIDSYFEQKYNVQVVEAFPKEPVTRNTIIWTIMKRTPGGGEGGGSQPKGSSFTSFIKETNDGFIWEQHTQQHTIMLEYTVYAASNSVADTLAWDLEKAVLQTVAFLGETYPGFAMIFDSQTPDSSMLWRQQDELIKRSIRFKVNVPVRTQIAKPQVRKITIESDSGVYRKEKVRFTRQSTDPIEVLTDDSSGKIVNIVNVWILNDEDQYEMLYFPTDWRPEPNQDRSVNIRWMEWGKVPDISSDFYVDYDVASMTVEHHLY